MGRTKKPHISSTVTLELTPLQRFLLLPAFRGWAEPFANAEQGRLFRQTYAALGLGPIGVAIDLNEGRLSTAQVQSRVPAAFTLTFHEAQQLRTILGKLPRNGSTELVLGPLADVLDDVVVGLDAGVPKAPLYDATAEHWDPPVAPQEGHA